LNVVLNAGQIEAVDFFVLPDQGIVRRTEHWVPEQAAKATEVMQYPVVVRVDAVQGKGGLRRRERNEKREHDQRNH
jgi:hypothetical protein